MAAIGPSNWKLLTEAIDVWSGSGQYSYPNRSYDRLTEKYEGDLAERLSVQMKHLVEEFYSTDAAKFAKDQHDMMRIAIADFKKRYPSAPEAICQRLATCYAFDFR